MTKNKNKNKNKIKKVITTVVTKKKPGKKSLGRTLLRTGGSLLGGLIGQSGLGASAGDFISDIVGLGDYKVNSNSIALSPDSVPRFNSTSDGVTIEHREYLSDVTSSTTFSGFPIAGVIPQTNTGLAYHIDPTNNVTFPWLARIAQNFEQYEFQGLVFCFKPTAGDAVSSTNNALGTVIMSTQYDVSRSVFKTKVEMDSYEFTTSCKPSESMIHPIECKPNRDILSASRYTNDIYRTTKANDVPGGEEFQDNIKEIGSVYIGTQGMQASGITVGEIWVSYKIKLSKPALPSASNIVGNYHLQHQGIVPVTNGQIITASTATVMNSCTSTLGRVFVADNGSGSCVLSLSGLPVGTLLNISFGVYQNVPGSGNMTFVPNTNTPISSAVGLEVVNYYPGSTTTQLSFFSVSTSIAGNSSIYQSQFCRVTGNVSTCVLPNFSTVGGTAQSTNVDFSVTIWAGYPTLGPPGNPGNGMAPIVMSVNPITVARDFELLNQKTEKLMRRLQILEDGHDESDEDGYIEPDNPPSSPIKRRSQNRC